MKGIARRALIFGITGPDGTYLSEFLLQRGYEVHGTSRSASPNLSNLRRLGIADQVRVHPVSIENFSEVVAVVEAIQPFEIYNLAGQSWVGQSFVQPKEAIISNVMGTLNVLEAIRLCGLEIRFYNASSSEIFGDVGPAPATVKTPFRPCTPYGVSKAACTMMVRNYRNVFGLFACSGIMYNHESPLRPEQFVTQRIVRGAIDVAQNRSNGLRLGNLDVVRDWGWGPDFVESMWLMLQQPLPEDFVIATGLGTSLQSFVDRVFCCFDLNWQDYVVTDDSLRRPIDIPICVGNPEEARSRLGWTARERMPGLADRLVAASLAGAAR